MGILSALVWLILLYFKFRNRKLFRFPEYFYFCNLDDYHIFYAVLEVSGEVVPSDTEGVRQDCQLYNQEKKKDD
jgi:hypothetical protein